MTIDNANVYRNTVLTAIAVVLAVLAFRPAANVPPVFAQADAAHLYVEPGINSVRNPDGTSVGPGKVVIDLRTGDIWGFPTDPTVPYPVLIASDKAPVSKPIYLGRFDFGAMKRP